MIQPSQIQSHQPFTFAVPGTVGGEVIAVETVKGEVVQRAKADKLGRIYMETGLLAGSYMVYAGAQGAPVRKIEVQHAAGWDTPTAPMRLGDLPQAMDLSAPLRIGGEGFSANAANMSVNHSEVLAASGTELVCAPLAQQPSMTELTVLNEETGETAVSRPILSYTLNGYIERNTLAGGDHTVLKLQFAPPEVPAEADVKVLNGPVSLGQGRQEMTATLRNGQAILPEVANAGSAGPFTLAWTLKAGGDPETPQGWVQKKATDVATASRLTENSNNKKDLAKEAETDEKLAGDGSYWDKDGKPTDPKKLKDFLNAEIARLEKIADAIEDAFKAGKAAGLDLTAK
ncbi:MAG: hypothetical protein EXQ47_08030 [Bryobacterales bacterium]|nr:hypothetical protein [Bryobacterales bacterium]